MSFVRNVTYLFVGMLFASCNYYARWQEAQTTIAIADSLDQNEHMLYDDTAALRQAIHALHTPFGRLFAHNELGRAHYYLGRNFSLADCITLAAEHYIAADQLHIDRTHQLLPGTYQ